MLIEGPSGTGEYGGLGRWGGFPPLGVGNKLDVPVFGVVVVQRNSDCSEAGTSLRLCHSFPNGSLSKVGRSNGLHSAAKKR